MLLNPAANHVFIYSLIRITLATKVKIDSSFFIQGRLRPSERERLRSIADNMQAGAFKNYLRI